MNLAPEQLRFLRVILEWSSPDDILRRMQRAVTPKTLAHLRSVLADFAVMGAVEGDGDRYRLTSAGQAAIAG